MRNGQPIQSSELCPQWPWCAIISHHLIKDKSCLSLLRSKPFRLLHHVVLLTHACHCLCLYIHIGDEFWTVWESMIPRKENVTSVQTFWPHTLNSCQLSSALYRKVCFSKCVCCIKKPRFGITWHGDPRKEAGSLIFYSVQGWEYSTFISCWTEDLFVVCPRFMIFFWTPTCCRYLTAS